MAASSDRTHVKALLAGVLGPVVDALASPTYVNQFPLLLRSTSRFILTETTRLVQRPTKRRKQRAGGPVVKKAKVLHYVEQVANFYIDLDFKCHFRLERTSVDKVVLLLGPNYAKTLTKPSLALNKLVLMSLWLLGNQESFRGVADRFGVGKGHAHRAFIFFCKMLCQHVKKEIVWPDDQEISFTVKRFEHLRGCTTFPNVVGAVDGCHIPIRSPMEEDDPSSYYNRKGFHSVILQGVCNSDSVFLDIFVGWPGSSNDARVWRLSPLGVKLASNEYNLPTDTHLVGDSAYPLEEYLMVPYKDNGHLSKKQKKFNQKLSSVRVVIEQAYGFLKGRFRRLRYLDVQQLQYIPIIVMAACILHNICQRQGDAAFETDGDLDNEIGMNDYELERFDFSREAALKRDQIADLF